MSYMGFTEIMTQYCEHLKFPTVLEIGIDRGQTSLPLIHNLANITGGEFFYVGIDIKPNGTFLNQVLQMRGPRAVFIESDTRSELHSSFDAMEEKKFPGNTVIIWGNSLEVLPFFKERKMKFDLVLIDGDHNYDTVSQELSFLKDITHPACMVVCDDYNSKRHSNNDTTYMSSESHADVLDKFTDLKLDTLKGVGANQAIDDWIKDNEEDGWRCNFLPDLEPAILVPPALSYHITGVANLCTAESQYQVHRDGIFRFKMDYLQEAK